MVLPIYGYGTSVLKKKGKDISEDFPGLSELLENMWETVDKVGSLGLAAPQIGKSIRIFLIYNSSCDLNRSI